MATIVALPSEGEVAPGALHNSSQDVSPSRGVCGRHPHQQHHGPRRHGSSPTRVERGHHHHRHHQDPNRIAEEHGHGDLDHSELMHHGNLHRGPRGRHSSRRVHEAGVNEHGSPSGQRRHRSLSPRQLSHHRPRESSLGGPNTGHREHEGRKPEEGAGN